jgi:hypothetical protein
VVRGYGYGKTGLNIVIAISTFCSQRIIDYKTSGANKVIEVKFIDQ